ncbi:hypothetical protein [Streptomyces sp. NPDC046887]|uniref:hypothetical protein n=1 Tax=Streptomyces sp. NPDC046887 TaxID=3155472 RepID=UPI003406311B
MIDYCAHVLSLRSATETLDQVVPGTGHADAWEQVRNAVAAEPGYALLGSLLDHLMERAEGADREHELLEEGAELHALAAATLSRIETFRSRFEAMVKSPGTATTAEYRDLVDDMKDLHTSLTGQVDRIKALRARAMPPFAHIPPHGAARNEPVDAWLWRDVHTARRTDALVRALAAAGDGSDRARALSFGALVGYAANCVGSSYLGSVVGGPRRNHPMRDRLVRYATGGRLRHSTHDPVIWPDFSGLRQALALGADPAALPAAVRTQIRTALAEAFPAGAGGPAVPPDLSAAHTRLLRHLELLDAFDRLPLPADIQADLLVRIQSGDGGSAGVLSDPQTEIGTVGDSGMGDPGDYPQPPPVVTGEVSDNGCSSLGLVILCITIIGIVIYLAVSDDDESGENPQTSQEALTNFLESENSCKAVAYAYHAHTGLWEAASRLTEAYKRIGLLYPDELDVDDAVFARLTTAPDHKTRPFTAVPGSWVDGHPYHYLAWPPHADIEQPSEDYLVMDTPESMLTGNPHAGPVTTGQFAAEVWLRHQDDPAPGAHDVNLDADADRGYAHPCWRAAPGGPIETLGYDEVV